MTDGDPRTVADYFKRPVEIEVDLDDTLIPGLWVAGGPDTIRRRLAMGERAEQALAELDRGQVTPHRSCLGYIRGED